MKPSEPILVRREVEGVLIPYGGTMAVPAGTRIQVIQSLGGTFTIMTDWGQMVRIEGKDADAIGESPPSAATGGAGGSGLEKPLEERVRDQLRTVFDPEIPVNVLDLGLVYKCEVTPAPEGGSRVYVQMTLTAPGCGMGDILKADAEEKIAALPGVKAVAIEMVTTPPWDPSRMSESAKLQLGMM